MASVSRAVPATFLAAMSLGEQATRFRRHLNADELAGDDLTAVRYTLRLA